MKLLISLFFCLTLASCAFAPYKDNYTPKKSNPEKLKNVTIEFVSTYPEDKFTSSYTSENFKEAGKGHYNYYNYLKIPKELVNCKIDIYHEIIHTKSRLYENVVEGASLGSLWIFPYYKELIFKTRVKLTFENKNISKEKVSDKMNIRFGLIYLPVLVMGLFNDEYRFKIGTEHKMYSYQVEELFDELKAFQCMQPIIETKK